MLELESINHVALIGNLMQQMCVYLAVAYLLSKTPLFAPLMQVTVRLPDKLVCYLVFSGFCIMGTYLGFQIEGAIANTRAIGARVRMPKADDRDVWIGEVRTGSGYQTAVLVAMNAWVYTIERQKDLHDFSQKKLRELHLRPKFQSFGDGFAGLPTFAPFDKILVTCGAETLPTELLHQLKVGGMMVIPLGKTEEQVLTRFTKKSEKEFEKEEFGAYKFVPMLNNTNH